MSKKILSVVLALVFVMTTFAVSAFAVGSTGFEDDAQYTQAWALGTPVDNGNGTWTVDVSLTANYTVGAISFVVTNTNPTGAVLTNAVKGAALTFEANVRFNATTGLVTIIPEPATDAEEGVNLTNGGVVATLTYTLAEDATAKIAIANDAKTETNPGGDLIAVRLSDKNLTTATLIYGQTVTSVGEEQNLGAVAAEPADLAKKAGAEAGIIIDTNKTFAGTYAGAVYGFTQAAVATFRTTTYLTNNLEATNGGSLEFGRSIGTAGYGTGTTITVKNSDGSVSKVYVVVILGDANCDGFININDTTEIKNAGANASIAPANSVKRMACNTQVINNPNMLHILNTNDTTAMKNHLATGGTKINFTLLATYQSNNTTFYK